jgi:hypothetical protein
MLYTSGLGKPSSVPKCRKCGFGRKRVGWFWEKTAAAARRNSRMDVEDFTLVLCAILAGRKLVKTGFTSDATEFTVAATRFEVSRQDTSHLAQLRSTILMRKEMPPACPCPRKIWRVVFSKFFKKTDCVRAASHLTQT